MGDDRLVEGMLVTDTSGAAASMSVQVEPSEGCDIEMESQCFEKVNQSARTTSGDYSLEVDFNEGSRGTAWSII